MTRGDGDGSDRVRERQRLLDQLTFAGGVFREEPDMAETQTDDLPGSKIPLVELGSWHFGLKDFRRGAEAFQRDPTDAASGEDVENAGIDSGAFGLFQQFDIVWSHIEAVAGGDPDIAEPGGDAIHIAHELDHKGGNRMVENLLRCPDLLNPRVAHHDDFIRQFERLFLIMSHEDRRKVDLLVKLPKPAAQVLAHLRIQRTERFVEKENAGADREGAGEGDALPLAAGKLVGQAMAEVAQLDEFEQFRDAIPDLGARRAVGPLPHAETEGDIVRHCHVPEEGVMLEDHADLALPGRRRADVFTVKTDRTTSRVGRFESGEDTQESGFARAGRTDEGHELAGLDLQRNGLEGAGTAKGFAQVQCFNAHGKERMKVEGRGDEGGLTEYLDSILLAQ